MADFYYFFQNIKSQICSTFCRRPVLRGKSSSKIFDGIRRKNKKSSWGVDGLEVSTHANSCCVPFRCYRQNTLSFRAQMLQNGHLKVARIGHEMTRTLVKDEYMFHHPLWQYCPKGKGTTQLRAWKRWGWKGQETLAWSCLVRWAVRKQDCRHKVAQIWPWKLIGTEVHPQRATQLTPYNPNTLMYMKDVCRQMPDHYSQNKMCTMTCFLGFPHA